MFNRMNKTLTITLEFEDIGDTSVTNFHVRDIWARKDLGNFSGSFTALDVTPHGDVFLRLTPRPPPPPPSCPSGYTEHQHGYWVNMTSWPCHNGDCDLKTGACSLGGPKCMYVPNHFRGTLRVCSNTSTAQHPWPAYFILCFRLFVLISVSEHRVRDSINYSPEKQNDPLSDSLMFQVGTFGKECWFSLARAAS